MPPASLMAGLITAPAMPAELHAWPVSSRAHVRHSLFHELLQCHEDKKDVVLTKLVGAGCSRRTKSQPQKRGPRIGVACAASTLEAAVVSPASAGLPSSKVFTNEDYRNFLKGYRSQVEEHNYHIEDDMIQGGALAGSIREGTCACASPRLY